jgi:hypothetical protein
MIMGLSMLGETVWTLWFDNFSSASKDVLTSGVFTSLLASLTGAFGGAWAAKRIAEGTKLREELQKEIRNTNAAASMVYGIANSHLGMKKQHIKVMHDGFFEQRQQLELFQKARKAGTVSPQQVFDFRADMQTLKPMYTPIEQIQKLIFNEISPPSPVLFVTPILIGALQSLNESLVDRNQLIAEWKSNQPKDLIVVYFGFTKDGIADQRYMTIVQAIAAQTDDVIAFGMMIGDALYAHAKRQQEKFRKRFRDEGPAVNKYEFTRFTEFLPPSANYEGFTAMFNPSKAAEKPPIPVRTTLWQKIKKAVGNSPATS